MKKIFALCLSFILAAAIFPVVFAEAGAPKYVTDKITVVARGDAGAAYADQYATLLLLKGDKQPAQIVSPHDILGIDETKLDSSGMYEFETGLDGITFDAQNVSDGHLFIRVGDTDITNTLISAYAEVSKQFFAEMKITASDNGRCANLTIRSPENLVDKVVFAVAQYDEFNKLISINKPDTEIINGGGDFSVSLVPAESAAYCRAFGWYKNMSPIGTAITAEKTPQKVLIIGNSFSIDSARYVNQIAASLGINLDVYVYQIGGSTVQLLYEQRENAEYYIGASKQGWYASKNGDDISTYSKSLDSYLTENTFDAVILQNYWGTSEGIQYYDRGETTGSYAGLPSPYYVALAKYVKEKQPSAQIMLNAVWSNEEGGPMSNYVKNNYAANNFENGSAFMYDFLEKYNGQSAADIGAATLANGATIGIEGNSVKQLPVGYAVQYARNWSDDEGNRKFLTTHDPSVYSEWEVNSTHDFPEIEGKIRLNRDGYHLSQTGRYLAGCIWVEALTGVDVRGASYRPESETLRAGVVTNSIVTNEIAYIRFSGINAEDGALLRTLAHEVAEKFFAQNVRTLSAPSLKF